jgi:hypothetical protein
VGSDVLGVVVCDFRKAAGKVAPVSAHQAVPALSD